MHEEVPLAVCSGAQVRTACIYTLLGPEFTAPEQHTYIVLQVDSVLTTKLDPDEFTLFTPPIGEGFYGTVYRGITIFFVPTKLLRRMEISRGFFCVLVSV